MQFVCLAFFFQNYPHLLNCVSGIINASIKSKYLRYKQQQQQKWSELLNMSKSLEMHVLQIQGCIFKDNFSVKFPVYRLKGQLSFRVKASPSLFNSHKSGLFTGFTLNHNYDNCCHRFPFWLVASTFSIILINFICPCRIPDLKWKSVYCDICMTWLNFV